GFVDAERVRPAPSPQCQTVPIIMSKAAKHAHVRCAGPLFCAIPAVLDSRRRGTMKLVKLVTPVSGDPDSRTQNLVGLGALAAELAAEGVSVRELFARTGVR